MRHTACRTVTVLSCALWLGSAAAQPALPEPASAPQPASAAALASTAQAVAQSSLAACFRQPPEYPLRARRLNLQGRTLVLFTVGAEGLPQEPRLMRSSGHAVLDNAAVAHLGACIAQLVSTGSERLPAGRYALPMEWRLE